MEEESRREVERKVPDVGDVGADRNAGQAGATRKRTPPCAWADGVVVEVASDCGDRQVIGPAGDNYCTAGTNVSRDGDRAVIHDEIELRLHHGRKHY